MTEYYVEIYGHPNQMQPKHMVVTSPYFDTRETPATLQSRKPYTMAKDAPIQEIVKMRDAGASWNSIAVAFNMTYSSVHHWYARAKGSA